MTINTENGVVVGNLEDKSNPTNPIAARMIQAFDRAFVGLLEAIDIGSIHEIGCGEGRLTKIICGMTSGSVRASDVGEALIASNLKQDIIQTVDFVSRSIYDLTHPDDSAQTVVCCEVLEHLDDPKRGLRALKSLGAEHYILSVPREPIWRILNMGRGRYLSRFGNTPGHVNHWTSSGFVKFLKEEKFSPVTICNPFPWTMIYGQFGN